MTSGRVSFKAFIEEISTKNTDYKFPEQAINQAESLKSLSSDLYTDNIRFIYELIQNADDAQAKDITLTILEDRYLVLAHDGKEFDEKDLQGICGLNHGTKMKDINKTGYKGLGFKSVFGKSEQVIIYSNREYFRFDSSYRIKWNKEWGTNDQQTWEREHGRHFIYPWQINPIWTNENEVANSIKNLFNGRQRQIRVAYAILLNNTREINSTISQLRQQPHAFLFLRNVSKITFLTESIKTISIGFHSNHSVKQIRIGKNIHSQWIIKRFELDIPDDIREKLSEDTKTPEKLHYNKKTELFFAAKYNNPNCNTNRISTSGDIDKVCEQDSVLFSFMPTNISQYKFPVLVNGNFITNASREQIHMDSIWNQWLFSRIGDTIFEWIKQLVVWDQFNFQAYRLIPAKLYMENSILTQQFNDSFTQSLEQCSFIRNRKNRLLKVQEVIMDLTSMSTQTKFINVNSMRQYIIENGTHLSRYADDPFIDYDPNLNKIGVERFTWEQCIDMFRSNIFLQTHSVEENKLMIEYFYTKYQNFDKNGTFDMDIKNIPFLMDQNSQLQLIKDIYFPVATIGDDETFDCEYFYINKTIVFWLNQNSQQPIKRWLQFMGVTEQTDLTYLHKTIIPNVTSYITQENAIKTIKNLFVLFQKNNITKNDLDKLRKIKLLTTRGTLVEAERCFFCDQYKPRLQIEEYLKEKVDLFLSFKYVENVDDKEENEDLLEWRRFFINVGVQEEFKVITFNRKLKVDEAREYGFHDAYLLQRSPDGKHKVDAFSELATITFMGYTENNYEFAKLFWSDVTKNIEPDVLTRKIRVYWGHFNKRGVTEGTLLGNADYIRWFLRNIKCIPTTTNICESSNNIFMNSKELNCICGKYMPFTSILLLENKSNWQRTFNFNTKLSIDNYFNLLEKIHDDIGCLKDNLDRIQLIYFRMLKEICYWTKEEREIAQAHAKSLRLLAENDQWRFSNELYFYMEGDGANNILNDAIPCLKLDYRNRNQPHLTDLLKLFHVKLIRMNDLKLNHKRSSPAEHFRQTLIEISPFLKKWLKIVSVPSDVISSIDKKIQHEYDFIESDYLELFYNQSFIRKTNVYFDNRNKLFYVTRPWDSETSFIDLPNKLCLLLGIRGFEDKLRFLLKGTIDEVKRHFRNNSIEIPTNKDIIILEPISSPNNTSENCGETVPSRPCGSNKSTASKKNTEIESHGHRTNEIAVEPSADNSTIQHHNNDSTYCKLVEPYNIPSQCYNPSRDEVQHAVPILMASPLSYQQVNVLTMYNITEKEQCDDIQLIDLSEITLSNPGPLENSFTRRRLPQSSDLSTGRIGEQIVYNYLLNTYCNDRNTVQINWLNEKSESQLPYDILLTINGERQYIEVKSTRINNENIFPLSISQIEFFLEHESNYFIYRVYINDKKLLILDNIRYRLMKKGLLACFLRILPNNS